MARAERSDPQAELREDLSSGALKPLYLLFGQEPFLVRQAFESLWKASCAGAPRGFNEQVFQAESCKIDSVISAARTLPMMAKRRTLAIRSAQKLGKDEQEKLADYCASPSPTTTLLLLCDDPDGKALDGRLRLARSIRKNGRSLEFKRLYGANLRNWMNDCAKVTGKKLETGASNLLETLMGNDLAQVHNALQVAALYVGESDTISVQALQEVATGQRQDALFEFLDAVGRRKLSEAMLEMQRLWSQHEDAIPVLAMLSRRVRQLLSAQAAADAGSSRDDALSAAGFPPNMLWKYQDQLGRYRASELRRAVSRLLSAESDVKGGTRIDPRWALERAVLELMGA
jgi:DNA polymerase-3 subunit delta